MLSNLTFVAELESQDVFGRLRTCSKDIVRRVVSSLHLPGTLVIQPRFEIQREEVSSIPENYSSTIIFATKSDTGFKRVSSQLRRWIEGVRSSEPTRQAVFA